MSNLTQAQEAQFRELVIAKFLSAMGQIRISQQKPAEWKICRLLQIFMEHYGVAYDGKILITEKVSQQMIADMLGMNRITVAKKFKDGDALGF